MFLKTGKFSNSALVGKSSEKGRSLSLHFSDTIQPVMQIKSLDGVCKPLKLKLCFFAM